MSFPDLHLMHAIFFIILQELSVTLKKDSRRPKKYANKFQAPQRKSGRGLRTVTLLKADEEVRTRSKRSEQRVQGGPCTWVARRGPQPPARRSLAAASRTRHKRFSSPLALLQPAMPPAASPPRLAPPAALQQRPVHHVDTCCCSRCLRAAAPCPPPCRAFHGPC